VPDWFPATAAVVGVVLAALIAAASTRYTVRQSAKASADTARVTNRQVDVGEWQAIVEALRAEVARLTGRIESLERERDAHRSLLAYTRSLLVWARRLLPDEEPPMPPTAFVDELAYITDKPPRSIQ